jgi:hypothetical protein
VVVVEGGGEQTLQNVFHNKGGERKIFNWIITKLLTLLRSPGWVGREMKML